MNATLDILSGDLSGRSYRLDESEFTIGRSRDCDLVIPKRYISRQHARIVREGRDFVIDGLSEKNPVVVDSRPIREHLLQDGDEFEVCGIRFRFRASARGRKAARQQSTIGSQPGIGVESDSGFGRAARGDAAGWRDEDTEAGVGARARRTQDDSWSEAPAADSWQDAPAGDSWSEAPADEGWQDAPAAAAGDSWQDEPAADSWQDAPAEGGASGSWETDRPRASREDQVVFEIDEEADPADKTGEVGVAKLRQLSSQGSGSGVGAAVSDGERTAELGKAVDPDDPDYDPFAALDAEKRVKKEVDPAREKTLKALSALGFVGIVLAVIVMKIMNKPIPPEEIAVPTPIVVRVGQSKLFSVGWAPGDRPTSGGVWNRVDGVPEQTDYVNAGNNVADIEWLLPGLEGRSLFLIKGLSDGMTTTFSVYFPVSNRRKTWTVEVTGLDPHAEARDKRKADFERKPSRELRMLAEEAFQTAERFRADRDLPHKEGYSRLAMLNFAKALDAANALSLVEGKAGGVSKRTRALQKRCEDMEQKARDEYEDQVRINMERYKNMVRANEPVEDRVAQLKKTLRTINHSCDVRYRRLHVILTEWYRRVLKGVATCEFDEN